MKILLAIDGSEYSLTAAEIIASRPWPPDSAVRILCVVRLPFTPTAETRTLPDSDYSRMESVALEVAKAAVDAALTRFSENSVSSELSPCISSEIILGHPQETLIAEADRWGADLIMLGSRGLGGFKRFLLGSVSTAVATHAHCSVEIARADEAHPVRKTHLKILLAVDGSEGSDAAVKAVLARPWPEGSTVKIIGAAEPPRPLTPELWALPNNYYQDWEKGLGHQVHAAVEKAAAQFAGKEMTVLPEVIKGPARAVILNEAESWGADLIVLGSRGVGGFERLLLGSVSHAVVTHAHCSVKIVRERQTSDKVGS